MNSKIEKLTTTEAQTQYLCANFIKQKDDLIISVLHDFGFEMDVLTEAERARISVVTYSHGGIEDFCIDGSVVIRFYAPSVSHSWVLVTGSNCEIQQRYQKLYKLEDYNVPYDPKNPF